MNQIKGFVLVGALIMVLVLGVLVTTATFSGYSNRINTSDAINSYRAQLAAEAGLDYALYRVWHQVWGSEKDHTYAKYVPLLANHLPFDPHNPEAAVLNLTHPLENGIRAEVRIQRRDVVDTNTGDVVVSFNVRSTGWLADNYTARKLEQTIQIREPQRGFDFALLTNNANCIFCHTRVQPLEALAGPPSEQNPWKRLKVGVLESLEVRRADDLGSSVHDAKSFVAGTVYTRGGLSISKFRSDAAWAPYGHETVVGGIPEMRFMTLQESGQLKIKDEGLKSFSAVNCQGGNCARGENFYFNYPNPTTVKNNLRGLWPDDELPEQFPLPVEDDNQNRQVDDLEWSAAVNKSLDGNDRNNPLGSISGGSITTNPSSLSGWPSSGNTSQLNSGASANLILDGKDNPLSIAGTVYIKGDVILRGRIRGKGKLIVHGNAYVLGDVIYRCGDQDCTAQQYAQGARDLQGETLPRFALAATGNIIIGDFLTPRYGNGLDNSNLDQGCPNPSSGLRNTCGGQPTTANQQRECPDNPSCRFASFPMQELTVFNEKELVRAIQEPSHTPRFYTLYEGEPVYYNSLKNGQYNPEGHDSYWYYSYLSPALQDGDTIDVWMDGRAQKISSERAKQIYNRATIVTLSARKTGDQPWVSPQTLKQLWNNSVEGSSNRVACPNARCPYRFDGLLYSANGIFSIIRGVLETDREKRPIALSNTKGSWDLRGALVAADTGVLIPGPPNRNEVNGLNPNLRAALNIYYDERLAQFFSLRVNQLRPFRSDWKMVAR
jgi:hypothetical protein